MKTNPKTRSLALCTCNFNTCSLLVVSFLFAFLLPFYSEPTSSHFRERKKTRGEKRRGGNASEPRKLEIAAKLHWQVACRVAKIIFAALSPRPVREGGDDGRKTGGVNNGERT